MRKLFILFFVGINFISVGQTWTWGKNELATTEESGFCVDPSGNLIWLGDIFYANGFINVLGTNTLQLSGSRPFLLLMKYDPSANLQWFVMNAAPNQSILATKVASDAFGNIFIGGQFSGSPSIGTTTINLTPGSYTTSPENYDFFVAKFNPNGALQWIRSGLGISGDEVTSICTDNQGNCIIAGSFSSPTLTIGNFTLTASHASEYFIAKYDTNGNALWAIKNNASLTDITSDINNNIIATGMFDSLITIGSSTINTTQLDYFIAKYNAAGIAQWASNGLTSTCPNCNSYGVAVKTDLSGNIFATGNFSSINFSVAGTTLQNTSLTNTFNPPSDVFLVKYNTQGTPLWAKKFGGIGADEAFDLDMKKNEIYVNGRPGGNILFGTNTLVISAVPNEFGIFIARYDTLGNYVLSTFLKGGGDDRSDMGLDNNCHLYLGGDLATPTIAIGTTTLITPSLYETPFIAQFQTSPLPTINVSGNFSLCAGNSTTLSAAGANTYTWTNGNTSGTVVVTPTANSTYTVTGTNTLGCPSMTSVQIVVNPIPNLTLTTGKPAFCKGDVITLQASGANTYTWSTGATTATINYTTSTSNTISVIGNFSLTNCVATKSIQLIPSDCTGLTAIDEAKVLLYPNPVNNILHVETSGLQQYSIKIYNAIGTLIQSCIFSQNHADINLWHLPSGLYVVDISSENSTIRTKVIKE